MKQYRNFSIDFMAKFLLATLCLTASLLSANAQTDAGFSAWTTLYKDYRPAKITMQDGRVVNQRQANVFLKNGRLLFKRGMFDMEANMSQIVSVEFADRFFVRVDTMLATIIDTVGANKILCTTKIDIEAYKSKAVNDRILTNLQIGEQVSMTTVELTAEDEPKYPLVNDYYFEIGGKLVEVHERTITRMLDKERRRLLKSYILQPDFDWGNREYLRKILLLFNK